MKSENLLKKIINRSTVHNNETIKLLHNLQIIMKNEHHKNIEDMLKKISSLYNLDQEQLFKRFLKKNKKNSTIEMSEDSDIFLSGIDSETLDDDNDSDTDEELNYEIENCKKEKKKESKEILKKMSFEDIEYYYEEKNNGKVYKKDESEIKIIGKFDLTQNKIIFL